MLCTYHILLLFLYPTHLLTYLSHHRTYSQVDCMSSITPHHPSHRVFVVFPWEILSVALYITTVIKVKLL